MKMIKRGAVTWSKQTEEYMEAKNGRRLFDPSYE